MEYQSLISIKKKKKKEKRKKEIDIYLSSAALPGEWERVTWLNPE